MRRKLLVWGVVAVGILALAWLLLRTPAGPPAPAPTSAAAPAPAARPDVPPPSPPTPPDDAQEAGLDGTWENVDLEAIRAEMPDNLYFRMSAPTDDPAVLEQRDAERARWNDEYGKVLSGTATEAEIDTFYEHRRRVSADSVEFASYVLDHHRGELPPRDVELLELGRRLHLARLAEIPRKHQEAYARKRQQDEARARWLEDEAAFAADPESD
jgi:hypothetical protein